MLTCKLLGVRVLASHHGLWPWLFSAVGVTQKLIFVWPFVGRKSEQADGSPGHGWPSHPLPPPVDSCVSQPSLQRQAPNRDISLSRRGLGAGNFAI